MIPMTLAQITALDHAILDLNRFIQKKEFQPNRKWKLTVSTPLGDTLNITTIARAQKYREYLEKIREFEKLFFSAT